MLILHGESGCHCWPAGDVPRPPIKDVNDEGEGRTLLKREQPAPTHSCSGVNSRQPARLWKVGSFVEDQQHLMMLEWWRDQASGV